MIHCNVAVPLANESPIPRVCAVSYLNTVPLAWGLSHSSEPDALPLHYAPPAECGERVRDGRADIGLIPVAELARIPGAVILADTCIACDGPVRSILLISKVPFDQIRTLAADENSRTSVNLTRMILRERYGRTPAITRAVPNLEAMLAHSDAALIIGDPALYITPDHLPYHWLDLGAAWHELTGLPMVFAAWCGAERWNTPAIARILRRSYEQGQAALDSIISNRAAEMDLPDDLVRHYLTVNIRYDLGARERAGLDAFLKRLSELP